MAWLAQQNINTAIQMVYECILEEENLSIWESKDDRTTFDAERYVWN